MLPSGKKKRGDSQTPFLAGSSQKRKRENRAKLYFPYLREEKKEKEFLPIIHFTVQRYDIAGRGGTGEGRKFNYPFSKKEGNLTMFLAGRGAGRKRERTILSQQQLNGGGGGGILGGGVVGGGGGVGGGFFFFFCWGGRGCLGGGGERVFFFFSPFWRCGRGFFPPFFRGGGGGGRFFFFWGGGGVVWGGGS